MAVSVGSANLVGFCTALVISYVGHYYFTFRSAKGHGTSTARFVMTASAAYLVNMTVVSFLGTATALQPELRLVAGIATMPAVTFILSRLWVY
jgi:putative flippase GtrA